MRYGFAIAVLFLASSSFSQRVGDSRYNIDPTTKEFIDSLVRHDSSRAMAIYKGDSAILTRDGQFYRTPLLCEVAGILYDESFWRALWPSMKANKSLLKTTDGRNYDLLYFAAVSQSPTAIENLISTKLYNVNRKYPNGKTLLHMMVDRMNPNLKALRLILKAGARKDAEDSKGYTPYDIAQLNRNPAVINLVKP